MIPFCSVPHNLKLSLQHIPSPLPAPASPEARREPHVGEDVWAQERQHVRGVGDGSVHHTLDAGVGEARDQLHRYLEMRLKAVQVRLEQLLPEP